MGRRENRSAWDSRIDQGNSFDLIRLLLSVLVLFEHAYFLVEGHAKNEPLSLLTGGQMHSGGLAVCLFFVISGFLITRSREKTSLRAYIRKRVMRITPGFLAASLVAIVLVGPLVSAGDYWRQNWSSMAVGLLSLKQVNPAGVLSQNPVQLLHGTLWTIRYEFDCYLMIALIGSIGLLKARWAGLGMAAIAAIFLALQLFSLPELDYGVWTVLVSSPHRWSFLFPFFFVGAAAYLGRSFVPRSGILLGIALSSLALGGMFDFFYFSVLIGGTYAVLFLALSVRSEIRIFRRRVDLSYGIYLYGWLVEQVLVHLHEFTPLTLFAAALPVTAILAYLSWITIERPALKWAHRSSLAPHDAR